MTVTASVEGMFADIIECSRVVRGGSVESPALLHLKEARYWLKYTTGGYLRSGLELDDLYIRLPENFRDIFEEKMSDEMLASGDRYNFVHLEVEDDEPERFLGGSDEFVFVFTADSYFENDISNYPESDPGSDYY
uniref:SMI1/KNR4 family protein n=1 Tax=Steinernema glaseri TaxID=37863 RepID=A0A1I8ADW3_9BILA